MKFKLKWIQKYVNLSDVSTIEIYNALNNLGLEVEWYKPICQGTNLISAKILSFKKHPDADKLLVCQVDFGNKEIKQIVCGASNFKKGDYVIVSKPGAILPGKIKIKKTEIRGQESNGMICSLSELGYPKDLQTKEDLNGIFRTSEEIPLGREDVLDILGLDDIWFQLAITPNRPDCLSIYNIARELAAYFNKQIKALEFNKLNTQIISTQAIHELVPAFTTTEIKGVSFTKSPKKLQNLIKFSGYNSTSHLVDISNFVSLELGQPIHFFDKDKLHGNIKPQTGLEGIIVGLDGNDYHYQKEDIVISDDKKVIAIAGVIGSQDSAVDKNTKTILVEVANFDFASVRKTSKRLNLFTLAATRFSKKSDVNQILPTLKRLTKILADNFAINIEPTKLWGQISTPQKMIKFDFDCITKVTGIDISKSDAIKILEKLDFKVNGNNITIPYNRLDVSIPEDIVEEISRVYGYDKIPLKHSKSYPTQLLSNSSFVLESKTKLQLAKSSYEVITHSLTSKNNARDFAMIKYANSITLTNPLSKDKKVMRQSIVPSLISVAKTNFDHHQKDINIFETSYIYGSEGSHLEVSLLHHGKILNDPVNNNIVEASFFTIKGAALELLSSLGFIKKRIFIEKMEPNDFYNHNNAANLNLDNDLIGKIGEIHPLYVKGLKMNPIYVMQINLSKLMDKKVSGVKVKPYSQYPSVVQDYTFDVDISISAKDVIAMVKKTSKWIIDIKMTSLYTGLKVKNTKKAITLNVTYNKMNTTINEHELKDFVDCVKKAAEKKGFEIRN